MDLKQGLAQLIDAYADAKASKNQILLQYATQELQNFLEQVVIAPNAPGSAPAPDGAAPEEIED